MAGAKNVKSYLEEKTLPLDYGDKILLYSDGVIDAGSQSGERFGLDYLIESLKKHGDKYIEDILSAIKAESDVLVGTQPHYDDITLVVIPRHQSHFPCLFPRTPV